MQNWPNLKLMPFYKNKFILLLSAAAVIIIISLLLSKYGFKKNIFKQPVHVSTKQTKIELPRVNPKPASLQKGPYACPTSRVSFCKEGKDIYKDNKYIGFGAKLATNSAILAAFNGDITIISATLPKEFNEEKYTIIYLDNKDKLLRGIYYFKGTAEAVKSVAEGDAIATSVGQIAYYDNNSLVFALVKNDFIKDERVKLTTKDFVIP